VNAPPYLTTRDVAALWTREREAAERRAARAAGRDPAPVDPISAETVRKYVWESTPAEPGQPARRYENHPMPMPIHPDSQRMVWVPAAGQTMHQLRKSLRDWYRNRRKNLNGPPTEAAPTGQTLDYLTIDDVARIWTEERRAREGDDAAPITRNTVKAYVWWSVKAPRGKPPNRYQDHPVPASTRLDGQRRVWLPGIGETLADVEEELRLWYRNRPGQGTGGGRKPASAKSTRKTRTT
jgi:hypothetical protein